MFYHVTAVIIVVLGSTLRILLCMCESSLGKEEMSMVMSTMEHLDPYISCPFYPARQLNTQGTFWCMYTPWAVMSVLVMRV